MSARFPSWILPLLALTLPIRAEDFADRNEIDPFHFLAGLSIVGAEMGYVSPPRCESFFREGGDLRPAELFLDAARVWNKGTTTHYYDPAGKRLVVNNPALSKALLTFYALPNGTGFSDRALIELEPKLRRAFVAGIYARCYRDGAFHGSPGPAMRATVWILLFEGCKVSRLEYDDGVPSTLHFKVQPSKSIARLFATVDKWRPPHVEWKPK